jgi:hypothetical protein
MKILLIVKLYTCSPELYNTPRDRLASISLTHVWNYNFSYIVREDHSFIQYLCHPHFAAQVWPPLVVSERALTPPPLPQLLLPALTSVCSYSGFIIYHHARVLASLARSTGTAVTYLSWRRTVYFHATVAQEQKHQMVSTPMGAQPAKVMQMVLFYLSAHF